MSNESCSYDCTSPRQFIPPYADISGIGVSLIVSLTALLASLLVLGWLRVIQIIIGYIGTAGIAVLVIVISHFTTYNPCEDPFGPRNSNDENINERESRMFRSNPIDLITLTLVQRYKHFWVNHKRRHRGEEVAPLPEYIFKPRNARLQEAVLQVSVAREM